MARTPTAPVTPDLLVWARERSGLSLEAAASKLAIDPQRLLAWEAGADAPTVAQLRRLANAYKRPLALFFLPEPPRDFMPLHDYRRLRPAEAPRWSPALRRVLRRAQLQQEVVAELRGLLGEAPPSRPAVDRSTSDPESFAAAARARLGISLVAQTSWSDRYEALRAWIAALEDAGVLVLHASDVPLEEMRGFSIAHAEVPIIVLNGADAPRARIFTALHEWAHLLLDRAGVCDLHDGGDEADDRIERFCNEVAGAILLPRTSLQHEPAYRRIAATDAADDRDVDALASRYEVSHEAVVRRLVSLGAVSWQVYLAKRAEYQDTYARRRSEQRGFLLPHRRCIRDLGRAYTRLVLEAYYRDRITVSDVSDYLGIRLKHLPRIEAEALAA